MGNSNSSQVDTTPGGIVFGQVNSGFGNQLFQIANAYAYSKEFGKELKLSRTWKGKTKNRPSYWDTYLKHPKIVSALTSDKIKFNKVYNEPYFSYSKVPLSIKNIMLRGYFQSEKYFIKYEDEIRELFAPPTELNAFAIQKIKELSFNEVPLVAVHIRRGDYVKIKKHNILDLKYYEEAKAYIEEKLALRPRYIYFTDDILWVKINFNIQEGDTILSSKSYTDYQEFAIMQKCDHFIIANSTFSWWAAWLSKTAKISKIVVAPFQWFNFTNYDSKESWKDIYSEKQGWKIIGKSEKKIFSKMFFMGVITCKKYQYRIESQGLMNKQLPFEFRYFVGDPSLCESLETDLETKSNKEISGITMPDISKAVEDKENRVVYLPCPDNYESLPKKVYLMLEWITTNYPDIEYIGKVDDDVLFNMGKYILYTKYTIMNKYDYAGVVVNAKNKTGKCHIGRTEDPELGKNPIKFPDSVYCGGPAYFLSRKSINIILEDLWKAETKTTIYEDQSIGHCLNRRGIYPNKLTIKNTACYWK
jgi:hypothetical protein